MKKQYFTIGGILVSLLILAGILFFVPKSEDNMHDDETIVITKGKQILSLRVMNKNGGYYAEWENGEIIFKEIQNLPLNENKLNEMKEGIGKLTGVKKIKDGEQRLEDFGLDSPSAKAKFLTKGGEEKEIKIGNKVPDSEKECRYIYWGREVYTCNENSLIPFFYGEKDFISEEISPSYQNSSESMIVQKVSINKKGKDMITMELTNSEKLSGYLMNSYSLTYPIRYPANADITEKFFPSLFGIRAIEIEKLNPDISEKEEYGLKNPYMQVEVDYTVEKDKKNQVKQFTLLLSEADEENVVYMMREGVPVIYRCDGQNFLWLDEDLEYFISNKVITTDVRSLSEISIETQDEHYIIQLNNIGTKNEEILCNGKKAKADSFRNLYYMLLNQSADEVIFSKSPEVKDMTPILKICFTKASDGTIEQFTYYKEETRKLYVTTDKGVGYRIQMSDMEQFLSALFKLSKGEKIEARY